MKKPTRKSVLPASVPFFGGLYRVAEIDGLISKEKKCGECHYVTRTLRIDAGMPDDQKLITLEHEKVHAILDDAEIKVPKKLEERICEAIARHRVFEMNQP